MIFIKKISLLTFMVLPLSVVVCNAATAADQKSTTTHFATTGNASSSNATSSIMNASSTNTTVASSTSCKKAALDAREDALGDARTEYNLAMKQALDARKIALKKALDLESDEARASAKSEAYNRYKASTTAAARIITNARRDVWLAYENSMSACTSLKKDEASKDSLIKRFEDKKSEFEKLIEAKKEELLKRFNLNEEKLEEKKDRDILRDEIATSTLKQTNSTTTLYRVEE